MLPCVAKWPIFIDYIQKEIYELKKLKSGTKLKNANAKKNSLLNLFEIHSQDA